MASKIDDRPRFMESLRANAAFPPLSKLARRVFDRLAETRQRSASAEFVAGMADELGVTHETAIEGLRLRSILERGAESPEEWALLVGLALARIGAELEGPDIETRARKLVKQADALEAIGIDVYSWVDAAMPATAAESVVRAMIDATIADDADGRAGRSRAYPRVEALRSLGGDAGRKRLVTELGDSPLAAVLGRTSDARTAFRFRARTAPVPPQSGVLGALRLVSGVALAQWIVRGLGLIVGLQNQAEISVDPGGIAIEAQTRLGERVLRSSQERFARASLVSAARVTKFPAIHLLVGALALATGIIAGGVVLVDGVRSGETLLLLLGAALILGGGVLDVVFGVLVPAGRGRAVLEVVVAPKRVLRLVDVAEADALATLDAVHAPRRR